MSPAVYRKENSAAARLALSGDASVSGEPRERTLTARPRRSWWPRPSLLVIALTSLGSAGCDALDSERQPYTPFSVASGVATTPEPAPETAPLAEAALPPAARTALIAPARAKTWSIAGRDLHAPDGLLFRLALVGGPQPEQRDDVLAWLVGSSERPVVGELWLYPRVGSPRLIAAAPSFLPTGPTCTHGTELRWTSEDSVTLDVQATCKATLLPRAPERSLAVLAPWREQPKVAAFQLAAAAPGERLDAEIASDDRDGDGRGDVQLSVGVTSPDGGVSRARFVWFDRTAGLSRDATEPLASFRALARVEAPRAGTPQAGRDISMHFAGARRLYASLCSESGTPRVFMETGAALDCGGLAEPLEALTETAVQAALNQGRVDFALTLLEQHRWFPVGNAKETDRFVSRLLARASERMALRRVIKLVPLKARPRQLPGTPHLSPLSFHADGSLLLLTADGLVRAAPDGRYEYDASAEVDPWSTVLTSATGQRLTGITFPCERTEVAWLASTLDGAPLPALPTSLIAPRPGNCSPKPRFVPPPIRPAGWGPSGISAFVGAALVGEPPRQPPLGSAFSPNGRYGITATEWGLFVPGGEKAALWVFEDAALAPQLRDCVVSNNAQAAACVLMGRAFVVLPDPKSG